MDCSISDNLVTLSVPSLAFIHPSAVTQFLDLTKRKIRISYGPHKLQVVDLFIPESNKDVCGFLFFVHGGAWGSGMPWMYRLVCQPFLNIGLAVAVVGYRTYPDGDVECQVRDLESASIMLNIKYPQFMKASKNSSCKWLGKCIMGHSSGAHITFLYMIKDLRKRINLATDELDNLSEGLNDNAINFDSFIGLSGVYSISHHFDYEAGRGVEEISPMKPACGYSRHLFEYHSPTKALNRIFLELSNSSCDKGLLHSLAPRILLIHGIEDKTVPFTSTSDIAYCLQACGIQDCTEHYIPKCGHADVILHLMLGGESEHTVSQWLQKRSLVKSNGVNLSKL